MLTIGREVRPHYVGEGEQLLVDDLERLDDDERVGLPEQTLLPDGSDAWVSLYETDGDVVFADLATGDAYWVGSEWTGEAVTRLPLGWPAVTSFVLWRLFDGGAVRPTDLAMLAAAAVAR